MILIIDYDMGNLNNVMKAFNKMGYADVVISNKVEDVKKADAFVLAGVGAFGDAMNNLKKLKLIEPLTEAVMKEGKPILGICLGVQLLGTEGEEGGKHGGLNFLPMTIKLLDISRDDSLRLPHIGWDDTYILKKDSILFKDVLNGADFYYVHSYYTSCNKDYIIVAVCDYGQEFVSAVEYKNIFGTQFHPEKSHRYGLQIIKNFADYVKSFENKEENKDGD
ncbi:MAG: imidazole glycerol phosphate synthase subunit HisH [Candidatus Woesearchaeota archaeon]|nr:MAG: imidazole glycerol phosphate synthase subunit HisH [Candidatus Woesearchaeota archaeon]